MFKHNLKIYGISNGISDHPYFLKLGDAVKDLGNLEYCYWSRSKKQPASHSSIREKSLLIGFGSSRLTLLAGYLIWMYKITIDVLRTKNKIKVYYVSKLDSALPLAFLSLFFKVNYVYFDPDSAAISYNWGSFIRFLIHRIESFCIRRSKLHVVPGENRIFNYSDKTVVLENTPSSNLLERAASVTKFDAYKRDKAIYVYINGWFTWNRGMSQVFQCADSLFHSNEHSYMFLFAGVGNEDLIEEIERRPNCIFVGQLPPHESLALYYVSDCVIALYDPQIEIHQRAEPNKWYDCIFTSTRAIVNSDIKASEYFIQKLGFNSVKYNDVEGLVKTIKSVKKGDRVDYCHDFLLWDVKAKNHLQDLDL